MAEMMSIVDKMRHSFKDPEYSFKRFLVRRFSDYVPDKWYLQVLFLKSMGYKVNFRDPKTFNEKLQWLKLYNRNPEYSILVDKYRVKEHLKDTICEKYLIPTLGVYRNVEDIDFEKLPDQFALKCNHDSGSVVICKNRRDFNYEQAKATLKTALNRNYYLDSREWPYKHIDRLIIAEPLLFQDGSDSLTDYKFFCFHGEPKYCQVISDRVGEMTVDFFDMEWCKQSFTEPKGFPHSSNEILRPEPFEEMIECARVLAEGKPFVRIDYYITTSGLKLGEITFFPTGGFGLFDPQEWGMIFGEMIKINQKLT